LDGDNIMAIGNLSRIGKKVPLTDLPHKGGSMDTMDFHSLSNEYRLSASLNTTASTLVGGFGNRYDIKSAFGALQGFKINSQTYMNGDTDYDGPYHVSEIFFDIGAARSGKLYIGHNHTLTSGNQWCADAPMVGAQILDIEGNLLENITFTTTTMEQSAGQYGTPPTPLVLSSATFFSLSTNGSGARFNYRSSTVSSRTGAADGFDNSAFDDTPYPLTTSSSQAARSIAQQGNYNYVYREVSNSGTYLKSQFMRTTGSYSFPRRGSIRLSYANTTETARYSDLEENNTFLIGIY